MSAQHTQGRLKTFNMYATPEIRDQDGEFVAAVGDGLRRSVCNARRLVSCWNALEDLPQAALDGGWTRAGLEAYAKRMEAQRDKLLAALEDLRSCCFDRRYPLAEFERLGDLYYQEFGRLRPGKDDPVCDSKDPENVKQYEQWSKTRYEQALDRVCAAIAEVKGGAA